MGMTLEKCEEWLKGTLDSFKPTPDMGGGDVSLRLPRIMAAAASVHQGSAFGYTFPEEIRAEAISRAAPLIAAALETWRHWLEEKFGEEGRAFYERAALNHGLQKPSPKSLHRDGAITKAFAALRQRLADTQSATEHWKTLDWLEPDEAHGFAVNPPAENAGERLAAFELGHAPLPTEFEALYAEMNGLWTGPVDPPGGERAFDAGEEYFVFVPLEQLLEHHGDRDDGLIVLNQHPDYFSWILLSTKDGAVYSGSKLDGKAPPKQVSLSLAKYLEQLASSYGSRY